MKHRTEAIYDAQMSPLVAALIDIAKKEGIPLFVSAGMLDSNGKPMTCDRRVVPPVSRAADALALAGVRNRYELCLSLVRGHAGLDHAAGLVISRFHEETPPDLQVRAGVAITIVKGGG